MNEKSGDAFLGAINDSSSPLNVTLSLNNTSVTFCIDTGPEVTVIPESVYELLGRPRTVPIVKNLKGPNNSPLRVKCQFIGNFQHGDLTVNQSVYVVEDLQKPLMGRPAIESLQVLNRIGAVDKQSPVDEFHHL